MNRFLLAATVAAAALVSTPSFARPMTATDMHMMHRLGAPSVSPDGRTAIFTLSTTDLSANKRSNPLMMLDLTRPGSVPRFIPGLTKGAHDAMFGADGAIWYLAPVGTRDQLHRMVPGGRPAVLSDFGADISGFKVSADRSRVIVWADTRDCPDLACAATTFPAKPAGSGREYDQMFVRHWDTWAEPGVKSRIYSFPIVNGRLAKEIRVTGALVGDTPSKPFGGGEEIAISADGRTVYFALREAGRIEPTSTNLDIFMAPADGSAQPVNLTAPNGGTDTLPSLSPDGRTLAYVSMARAGYEADRQVIMLRDLASGRTRALTAGWDRSAGSLAWAKDGRSLLITAEDVMEAPVWRVDVASGAVTRLTGNGHAGNIVPLPGGGAVFTQNSIMAPDDLYRLDARGRIVQLTNVNRALLDQLDPVRFEKFAFKGANNDQVWGFKLKPAGPATAASTAKLPIAFVVHGGPQGSFGNGWSYRWNSRLFSAPGYAVVSVDFHGSTGYGQAFTDSITNDWGGKPLEDLKRGLAAATAADPQLDATNVCALGASY
ncbi:MAG TPA: prolyl oligopeptidase family serine peptidase, partial [Sphingomicrobium sp.]|nr:prolyl oligopeptidase family serine peptidase [Sphingomicrobium sp.]